MIKIKSMTVEANGTGGMDFTFDNPEDLARLWSLGVEHVEITGSIEVQVMEDGNLKAVHSGVDKPPIPEGVYYSLGNFYDMEKHQGLGMEFFKTWVDRGHEFPREPQR